MLPHPTHLPPHDARAVQVAVAAFILYTCPTDNKDLWDIMVRAFSNQSVCYFFVVINASRRGVGPRGPLA